MCNSFFQTSQSPNNHCSCTCTLWLSIGEKSVHSSKDSTKVLCIQMPINRFCSCFLVFVTKRPEIGNLTNLARSVTTTFDFSNNSKKIFVFNLMLIPDTTVSVCRRHYNNQIVFLEYSTNNFIILIELGE